MGGVRSAAFDNSISRCRNGPAPDGGDDPIGIGGPGEGFRVGVLLGHKAVDGSLEVDQRVEGAAFQAPAGKLGEEALDRVQP